MIKYANVVQRWHLSMQTNPEWRKGQALMNAINEVDKKLYKSIVTDYPDCDCFYNDDWIHDTLVYVAKYYNEVEGV